MDTLSWGVVRSAHTQSWKGLTTALSDFIQASSWWWVGNLKVNTHTHGSALWVCSYFEGTTKPNTRDTIVSKHATLNGRGVRVCVWVAMFFKSLNGWTVRLRRAREKWRGRGLECDFECQKSCWGMNTSSSGNTRGWFKKLCVKYCMQGVLYAMKSVTMKSGGAGFMMPSSVL